MLLAGILSVFRLKRITVVVASRRTLGIRLTSDAFPCDRRKDTRFLFGLKNWQNLRANKFILRLDNSNAASPNSSLGTAPCS